MCGMSTHGHDARAGRAPEEDGRQSAKAPKIFFRRTCSTVSPRSSTATLQMVISTRVACEHRTDNVRNVDARARRTGGTCARRRWPPKRQSAKDLLQKNVLDCEPEVEHCNAPDGDLDPGRVRAPYGQCAECRRTGTTHGRDVRQKKMAAKAPKRQRSSSEERARL